MLFDAILQTPQFFSDAFSFFVSYILLPITGVVAGFSFIVFAYGFVRNKHLGEYYTSGEDEGKALMGQGLIYMALCAVIFILAYFFLA